MALLLLPQLHRNAITMTATLTTATAKEKKTKLLLLPPLLCLPPLSKEDAPKRASRAPGGSCVPSSLSATTPSRRRSALSGPSRSSFTSVLRRPPGWFPV